MQNIVEIGNDKKKVTCGTNRGYGDTVWGFMSDYDNDRNLSIVEIDDCNPYVSQGLAVGLYIHRVNGVVVDDHETKYITNLMKQTELPITITFNHYAVVLD